MRYIKLFENFEDNNIHNLDTNGTELNIGDTVVIIDDYGKIKYVVDRFEDEQVIIKDVTGDELTMYAENLKKIKAPDPNIGYPKLSWIRQQLRYNLTKPMKKKVLAAYVVGSVAKGTSGPDSDLDIAVIIEPMSNKSSLKFTDEYHSHFYSNDQKPEWNGRVVDFQFFYPGDPELNTYSKIELK